MADLITMVYVCDSSAPSGVIWIMGFSCVSSGLRVFPRETSLLASGYATDIMAVGVKSSTTMVITSISTNAVARNRIRGQTVGDNSMFPKANMRKKVSID